MILELSTLQKEAEHSYSVYLDYSDVLNDRKAKLSLLKWIDTCSTAISYIENPQVETYALLWKELEFCAIQPMKYLHDSAAERYTELTKLDPTSQDWYPRPEKPLLPEIGAKVIKSYLIAQTNAIFKKLNALTNYEYKEIVRYDSRHN